MKQRAIKVFKWIKKELSPILIILVFSGIGLGLVYGLLRGYYSVCIIFSENGKICEIAEKLVTSPTLVTALAAAPALILLWHWRTKHRREEIANADRRLITERYSKAIDHLGHGNEVSNLGAIYELEAISRESQPDHWTVVETLSAFIRKKRPLSDDDDGLLGEESETTRLPTDIQAALTVLGRREHRKTETDDQRIDLSHIDLCRADLTDAHIQRVNCQGAKLQYAKLKRADLKKADLFQTDLRGAYLQGVNLQEASLFMTDFSWADLKKADLSGADLSGADLPGANFIGTNLTGTNLTATTFKAAKYVPKGMEGETIFPDGFDLKDPRRKLIPVNIWGKHIELEPEPEAPKAEEPGQPPDEAGDS